MTVRGLVKPLRGDYARVHPCSCALTVLAQPSGWVYDYKDVSLAGDNGVFHPLEMMVLEAVASQYPAEQGRLRAQFRSACVVSRRNSGAGFFTDFRVDRQKAGPVQTASPIGHVWGIVEGFESSMVFLVFMRDGYTSMLEGALCGDGTTEYADFSRLGLTIET